MESQGPSAVMTARGHVSPGARVERAGGRASLRSVGSCVGQPDRLVQPPPLSRCFIIVCGYWNMTLSNYAYVLACGLALPISFDGPACADPAVRVPFTGSSSLFRARPKVLARCNAAS